MQYADGEGQCSSLCSFGAIYAWDVENTWLVSLIWISGRRQMKGIWISRFQTLEDTGSTLAQNLAWAEAEMAAMASGTVELNILAWNQMLTKYVKDGQPEKVMQLFQQM
jgi:pentatricopeptide repeat protein